MSSLPETPPSCTTSLKFLAIMLWKPANDQLMARHGGKGFTGLVASVML
jgi:hypothetical protein